MFFLDPLVDLKNAKQENKNGGYAQISDCYVHTGYVVCLLLLLYCGALVRCPDASKTKTLSSDNTSVVCFSCLKKFKCLGDVLNSVAPITFCHIEVPSFGRFYNLAQILI